MLKRPPQQTRFQRYRERQRAGLLVPQLEAIGSEQIEFLIATRWLDESDAADRNKIGAAISEMLKDAARR